ncbi:MAG: hydrogenase iron-sulfur subunit [Desulfotomaculum sp.]|nr:hydrogenase iron-sulfur subunit [Desulfotomaculum sp.]
MDSEFEPKIVGIFCNWCSYTGADLAGTSRIQYPPNIRIVRVMCTGSVDPMYLVRPLLEGADGVLVSGCHPGDCHYGTGNYKARRKIAMVKEVLKQFGIEEDRLWFRFISASEGNKIGETVSDMVKKLKELGPNPLAKKWQT